jgi:DNA-binding NtrC family response regulator
VHARATILVADDEPLTRWALKRTLEQAHLEVALASSRDAVQDLLATGEFDVVVLANELRHECMLGVLAALAGHPRAQGLVILYDGDSAEELQRVIPTAVVVQKPFGLEAVTAAVEGFLEPTREAC